jgi:hypothetical protein
MKRLIAISILLLYLLCPATLFEQAIVVKHKAAAPSYEYLRPTADAGSTAVCGDIGGTSYATSMSAVYTSKSGAGPTGSGVNITGASFTEVGRKFTTWQTTVHSYSALTVYVSSVSTNPSVYGNMCYSIDGGSTWTNFASMTSSQATHSSYTITGATLSNVQILITVANFTGGSASAQVYDIWTMGTY